MTAQLAPAVRLRSLQTPLVSCMVSARLAPDEWCSGHLASAAQLKKQGAAFQ